MSIDGTWRKGAEIVRTLTIEVGRSYKLRSGERVEIRERGPIRPPDPLYTHETFKGHFDEGGFGQWHLNGIFIASDGSRESGLDIMEEA